MDEALPTPEAAPRDDVLPAATEAPPREADPAAWPRTGLAAGAVVLAALVASYAPNLVELVRRWSDDPNYSHGFLVGPIALAILWQRKGDLGGLRPRPSWPGWAALAAVLAVRALLFERNEQWLETATLIPALVALVWAFGRPLVRWAAPAIGFLVFLIPLPPRLNMILAGPLQALATAGSTTLLQALGLPVLARGNVIYIGRETLEVAQACNGLSMLLSFVTLVTAMTILLSRSRPRWEQVVLLLSAIPIALVSNILRIAATAWAYHLLGAERGEKLAHDLAGWAMMPLALALALLELKALSWLVVAEEAEPEQPLIMAPQYEGPAPARKPTGGKPMVFPVDVERPAPAPKKPVPGPGTVPAINPVDPV